MRGHAIALRLDQHCAVEIARRRAGGLQLLEVRPVPSFHARDPLLPFRRRLLQRRRVGHARGFDLSGGIDLPGRAGWSLRADIDQREEGEGQGEKCWGIHKQRY